jgi:tripartite-type tricarboxylate transporter receptor subunit TctC
MKRIFAVAAFLCLPCIEAHAAYPEKQITIIVPFPAGSSSDLIPRLVAPIVSRTLRVPVIVDNRAGANGSVGAAFVARAPADGYTILLATTGVLAINPWIYAKPLYRPDRDFAPIINAAATPNLIVVHPKVKATTMKELAALARGQPGHFTYASAGNGSTSHLCGEQLAHATGAKLVHIPYKGPAPAAIDLLGGLISMMCDNFSNMLPYVEAGRVRPIAVTGPQRSSLLPDVPTAAEAGYPEVQAGIWYGFVAPAGTPSDIVQKLNTAFSEALNDPMVKSRLAGLGLRVVADKPDSFKHFIARESARLKSVVAATGITAD